MEWRRYIRQFLTPNKKLIILNYHQVSPRFDTLTNGKYIWNELSFFTCQLEFLKKNFTILSLTEAVAQLRENRIHETIIALTFDDADKSVTEYIMPALSQLNIPATFFVNTAYPLEKPGYWFNAASYFSARNLPLNSAELREIRNTTEPEVYKRLNEKVDSALHLLLDKSNLFYSDYEVLRNTTGNLFHFGLHGHEHLRFSMLTEEEQRANLQKNISALQSWHNYVPFFAIPFGKPKDWNKTTIRLCKELSVIPLLANTGYNVKYQLPLMRFSVDGIDLKDLFQALSPFPRKYYKLNSLVN